MSQDKLKTEQYRLAGGMNSKASPYANDPMEMRRIVNMNFSTPGALSKRPGTAAYLGETVSGRLTGGVEYEKLNGSAFLIVSANTNLYSVTSSYSPIVTGLRNDTLFDFVTFVDRLFGVNGQDFIKFDGSSTYPFSLPSGYTGWGLTGIIGGSLTPGVTGTFVASYGYVNERGYFGSLAPGLTITINGVTFNSIAYFGLTAPAGIGATAISLFRSSINGTDLFGTTTIPTSTNAVTDPGWPLTNRVQPEGIYFTLIPRYLEIFSNQLFMGGFSGYPSTIWWSQVGEPEGIEPNFSAEFRTNDGDRITAMRAYNGSLIAFKERSYHRVTGDDPDNFQLLEISDQYGCISNRAAVVFNDTLWFLDGSKGICEFNGANTQIVSNKVEDAFLRMNLSAARENAWAFHYKQGNEVWFGIPVDGLTTINLIVVYDYLTQAWTTYEGVNAAMMFLAKGTLDRKMPFLGGYSGNIGYFGTTLYNDSGAAITCMILPPFTAPTGQTTERQFRRLYVDLVPILGFTQAITVNFRTNYGSTIQLTRTIYQNPFQTRIDFGLSAKSLQPELVSSSASFPLVLNGYALESRFQRSV